MVRKNLFKKTNKLICLLAGIFLVFTLTAKENTLSIQILVPEEGATSGDILDVIVKVDTTNEIQTVIAKVDDRTANLRFRGHVWTPIGDIPAWLGEISLTGLLKGEKQLIVTATDAFDNQAQAQSSFIYNPSPQLIINSPLENDIARPLLPISVVGTDDDPAGLREIQVYFGDMNFKLISRSIGSSLNETRSLAGFDGRSLYLKFKGIDNQGESSPVLTRQVYIESCPRLIEVEKVSGTIFDFDSERILFRGTPENVKILKILDRLTGKETIIFDEPTAYEGYLTPLGAIFSVGSSDSAVYEWGEGALIDHGLGQNLKVKGDYCIWDSRTGEPFFWKSNLIFYNLISGEKTMVVEDYRASDIASNGDIVFGIIGDEPDPNNTTINIFRYRKGEISQLTHDDDFRNYYPLTDGTNVVYIKEGSVDSEWKFAIAMYGPHGEEILTPFISRDQYSPYPGEDYQINNGWVAFSKVENKDMQNIWLRSPEGEMKQVTYFNSRCRLKMLGPNGDIVFNNQSEEPPHDGMYMAGWDMPPVFIGGHTGQVFWQDQEMYKVLIRTIFKIEAKDKPPLLVTPTCHDFGWASIGSSSKRETFSVRNNGSDDLTIMDVRITGLDADEFFITNDNCSGRKIASLESSTVDVIFSPTSLGLKTAILSISTDDTTKQPYEILILGGLRASTSVLVSGAVRTSSGEGIPNVTISFYDVEWSTTPRFTTDQEGNYIAELRYGFDGIAYAYKTDYVFSPSERRYGNLIEDKSNEDYIAFRKPYAPKYFEYHKVLNRSLFLFEYVYELTWRANSENRFVVGYRIYQLKGDEEILIAFLDADTFSYRPRREELIEKPATYKLVAVDDKGREGDPAYLTIDD
jgi:hypothetical protein